MVASDARYSASASSSTRAPPTSERFSEFINKQELAELGKGLIPANTTKCTKWALKTFELWKNARNQRFPYDRVPDELFQSNDPSVLSVHLTRFAVEARKSTGEHYPPSTLHQLLCGLLRQMREINPNCPNFLDKKDVRFQQLHCSLDVHFKKLHSTGIGRQIKHAEVISKQDENRLWESGVMGVSDPKSLQNAVFYTVGKMLCLRGGVEHRSLKLSQFQRKSQPDHYIYVENVSKNRNGSFKQLHVNSKTVPVYAYPEASVRCPVHIIDLYISKLPPKAVENDVFYVRPLENVTSEPFAPWYSAIPVGKHTLNDKVKKMCKAAGIEGNKTNHSLRATGATQMYHIGVPEKIIQERTGHRSLEGLRSYERSNEQQHQAASAILSAPKQQMYAYSKHSATFRRETNAVNLQPSCLAMPGISLQNLNGCTININQAPSSKPAPSSSTDVIDKHVDNLLAEISDF